MKPVVVGAVQMASVIGATRENNERAAEWVVQAAAEGAQLITLPELFTTGYFCHTSHTDTDFLDLAEPVDGPTIATFGRLAEQTGTWLNVPFLEEDRTGVHHNSSALIDDTGAVVGVYRKVHLPWSHTGWEKFYMRPGYHFPVFDSPFGRIGIILCYDRDFPEAARALAVSGAELVLVPNGASRSLTEMWTRIMSVRAYENQVGVLGCSLTGRTDPEHHEFCGHSAYVEPDGRVQRQLGFDEGLLLATHDPRSVVAARRRRFMQRDRRPETYGALVVPQ